MGNPPPSASGHEPWLAKAFTDAIQDGGRQPDNPAAAYLGGLTAAAIVDGRAIADSFTLDPAGRLVVLVPDRQILTADARAVLPDMVPRHEAVETVHHAVLMLSRLRDLSGFPRGLGVDHLHEKYRRSLFPESEEILSVMRAAGAATACMSGSGPTMLAICHQDVAGNVRDAGERAMRESNVPLRFADLLEPDFSGLRVGGKRFRAGESAA